MSRTRIVHLSDPHFGTVRPAVLESLTASLAELKPNLILMTGDITQRARRSQFRAAKEFLLGQAPIPLVVVPGNHDIPLFNLFARAFRPYRAFQRELGFSTEADFVHGDIRVWGFNSTSKWRHVQGDFDLHRVQERLAKHRNGATINIAAFHHPMDCAKYVDEKNLLKGRDGAIDLFDRNEIDLMIGGHIHDPYVSLSRERYPRTKRTMIIAVAGTCLSWRTRPPASNSFNLLDVDSDGEPTLDITRYDRDKSGSFLPKRTDAFRRRGETAWERRTI